MTPEETISSEVIFTGRAVNLRIDTVANAGGNKTTREIVEHADVVAVVPVDEDGNILLVRQFRKPVEKELQEIPAGGIDPGETAEEAVRREMQEETGFLPGRIARIGGFYATPGYCTEYLSLYLASELTPSRLVAEDTEGIQVIKIKPAQIPELIQTGRIEDAKSIVGLLTYLAILKGKAA
ncbi:NUDIX hydrolase [Chloroflexota bacterium]